jgi:hypothetical protein
MEDNQLLRKEVIFPIEPPLDHYCCSSALGSGVDANLTVTKNSTTTNNTQVWALTTRLLEAQRLFFPS